MKFEDVEPVRPAEEKPVAWIDADGDLIVVDPNGNDHVCIRTNGSIVPYNPYTMISSRRDARMLYYAGDSIKITF